MTTRCNWVGAKPNMIAYHDTEWGKIKHDDTDIFEMLVLEAFQVGLSWQITLDKREGFRRAFANFNIKKVAAFDADDVADLVQDQQIIRNRAKILAAINNARVVTTLPTSFYDYMWQFVDAPIINHPLTEAEVPAKSELSSKISKQMKKDGFTFIGPVTAYSFMQSIGMINDHLDSCDFKY